MINFRKSVPFRNLDTFIMSFLLFLTPIFYIPFFVSPFVQGKELFFKLIVIILTLIISVKFFANKKININNQTKNLSLLILVILQFILFLVTDLLSNTPIVSIFGTYSRGYGLIIEFYLLLITIYSAFILQKKHIKRLLKVVFFSGVIVSMYAFMQKLGYDVLFHTFSIKIFDNRAFSFLGNPSYLGQIMVIYLIIGAYLSVISKRMKYIYIPGTILFFLTILISGTRAALVGVAFILLILTLKFYKQIIQFFIRRKRYLLILLILLSIAIGTYLKMGVHGRYSFSNTALRSLHSRLQIWTGASDLINDKIFIGHGGETFYIYFPEIIDKEFLTLEENLNINADRLHNETLEVLFAHGIFATLIYLLIFLYILVMFFREKKTLYLAIAAVVLANTIQNQFAFPDISISLLYSFFLGLLISKDSTNSYIIVKKHIKFIILLITITIVIIMSYITVYKPYMSQLEYTRSINNYTISYDIAVNRHKSALRYTPYYSELWYNLMFLDPSSMPRALYNLEQIDGDSGNVLAWKGNLYSDTDPDLASKYYTMALKKNPYNPNWIRAFADMLYKNGDYQNSLYMYDKYLESIPDFWKWAFELGKHTKVEQKSYETFIKHTPYFWDLMNKIQKNIEYLKVD